MGCDIHFYVEKKNENGIWESADKWYAEEDGYFSTYKFGPGFTRIAGPFYSNRNYDLFGILANVRNGSGFARVDTGDGFVPIHETRGIPEDVSHDVRMAYEHWDSDGHSHSWATVQELMDYDWTRTTKKRGWVTEKEFCRFLLEGAPDSWCGGVSGPGIEHISNEEMKSRILERTDSNEITWKIFHGLKNELFGKFYTQVLWEISYYDSGREFLSETMPKLWRLGKPEDVRCVYWFDN